MGLSASQARFLQLTARKSNTEYQAQQINFQRLQWADKLSQASNEYQDATSNRKLTFSYNGGTGIEKVDITYQNYKNYMNKQLDGLVSSHQQYYLVSASGKIIVANEEEREAMWKSRLNPMPKEPGEDATKEEIDAYKKQMESISPEDIIVVDYDEKGEPIQQYQAHPFKQSDFMIAPDLDNADMFQDAIKNGVYYFATLGKNSETGAAMMKSEAWDALGAGAIGEEYDTGDDLAAESKFKAEQDRIQLIDKKLELQLDKLETERNALQTEIDSVSKVIEDNVEGSFKVFS